MEKFYRPLNAEGLDDPFSMVYVQVASLDGFDKPWEPFVGLMGDVYCGRVSAVSEFLRQWQDALEQRPGHLDGEGHSLDPCECRPAPQTGVNMFENEVRYAGFDYRPRNQREAKVGEEVFHSTEGLADTTELTKESGKTLFVRFTYVANEKLISPDEGSFEWVSFLVRGNVGDIIAVHREWQDHLLILDEPKVDELELKKFMRDKCFEIYDLHEVTLDNTVSQQSYEIKAERERLKNEVIFDT